MAEKVYSKRISSAARSSNSKRSILAGRVRVVHISNPTVVKANESEFRAVVQSLTGQKRAAASHDRDLNLYSDLYSPNVKVAKHEDGLQCLKDMKNSESALVHDTATVSECCNGKNHGDVTILEDLKVQPIQFDHDYIASQYREFETRECFGYATRLVSDIFSPSILLSEFEYNL